MKNTIYNMVMKRSILLSLLIIPFASFSQTNDSTVKTTAIGTSRIWGKVDGLSVESLVQGPSAADAPLQVACVFEYTEGDIYNPPALPATLNGMVHLDEAFHGKITELRKSGKFEGHLLETLLIEPPKGTLKAKKLLLIGLGNRNAFSAEIMIAVGATALREACRLGVSGFAFASDLKDAGIDSPTALVAENVTKGIITAYHTQLYLQQQHLTSVKHVTKATLLAGPAFFETSGEGIKEAIATFNR